MPLGYLEKVCAEDVWVSCPGLPAWLQQAAGHLPLLSSVNSQNCFESSQISAPSISRTVALAMYSRLPLLPMP